MTEEEIKNYLEKKVRAELNKSHGVYFQAQSREKAVQRMLTMALELISDANRGKFKSPPKS